MTITERTLKRWRKDALEDEIRLNTLQSNGDTSQDKNKYFELQSRIKRMTQVLLDQHLMKGK